jgi:2'-5' RNA ligase
MSTRDQTKRLFVAVDLSIKIVERLTLVQESLAEDIEAKDDLDVRWVDAPNIHVTLKFLGETDPALAQLVDERLEKLVRPLFPFEVRCEGLGAFPSPDAARVLWAGLDPKGAEVMGLLRLAIERELDELGFSPDERDYKPHVTLGRVRARSTADLSDELSQFERMEIGECWVRDLVLFESILRSDGPTYRVINRYQLGEK